MTAAELYSIPEYTPRAGEPGTSAMSDFGLARMLHAGDMSALEELYRRHRIRFERPTEKAELPEQVSPGTERPDRLTVVERISLDEALAKLPPGYRAVFVLFDVEGYTHDEVASLLGCSEGTSKSQLWKARKRLRTLLRRPRPAPGSAAG